MSFVHPNKKGAPFPFIRLINKSTVSSAERTGLLGQVHELEAQVKELKKALQIKNRAFEIMERESFHYVGALNWVGGSFRPDKLAG